MMYQYLTKKSDIAITVIGGANLVAGKPVEVKLEYTAQGHTVGLAQRMESLASPDTCYLSASTAALAGSTEQEQFTPPAAPKSAPVLAVAS